MVSLRSVLDWVFFPLVENQTPEESFKETLVQRKRKETVFD